MDEIVIALAEQHAELAGILAPLDDTDWRRDSPCDGWSVADVVLHLSQTDELAIGSVQHRFEEALAVLTDGVGFADSIDAGADVMVVRDRVQSVARSTSDGGGAPTPSTACSSTPISMRA